MADWLHIHRGDAPLIVSFPHTGAALPEAFSQGLASSWLARRDADWRIEELYDFARDLGATLIRTSISRSVIDVNRDPFGQSLYPGQATTELCPTTTFDGETLYRAGCEPDLDEIAARREAFFDPYHAAIETELARLRATHRKVVLYDAHSIRSAIPRLFEGELPHFNIGDNDGRTCDLALRQAVEAACDAPGFSRVVNGRFKGGWTTRRYGQPAQGVHAIQMELAIRGYLEEPADPSADTWPPPYDPQRAAAMRAVLTRVLEASLAFARA